MKEKKLPAFVQNRFLYAFFQSKLGRIVSNWVFQGMLYMNPVETGYKLSLDLALTLGIGAMVFDAAGGLGWFLSWMAAHTLNWVLNGQPVAMRRHLDWGKNNPKHFIHYIEGLQRRIERRSYLAGAASFGSLSKGKYKPTSDLDIRFVFKQGFLDRVRTANFCFVERLRAAFFLFPLDLYAFELDELKRKMHRDEVPVIFHDPLGLIERSYAETVPFFSFARDFRINILGGRVSDAAA